MVLDMEKQFKGCWLNKLTEGKLQVEVFLGAWPSPVAVVDCECWCIYMYIYIDQYIHKCMYTRTYANIIYIHIYRCLYYFPVAEVALP